MKCRQIGRKLENKKTRMKGIENSRVPWKREREIEIDNGAYRACTEKSSRNF